VQHGTILGDDPVERIDVGERVPEILELPARDEEKEAAGFPDAPQPFEDGRRDEAPVGQGSVVVQRQGLEPMSTRGWRRQTMMPFRTA
jgi:hypothetical protein